MRGSKSSFVTGASVKSASPLSRKSALEKVSVNKEKNNEVKQKPQNNGNEISKESHGIRKTSKKNSKSTQEVAMINDNVEASILSISQTEFNNYPMIKKLHSTLNPTVKVELITDIEVKEEPEEMQEKDNDWKGNFGLKSPPSVISVEEKVKMWSHHQEQLDTEEMFYRNEKLNDSIGQSVSQVEAKNYGQRTVDKQKSFISNHHTSISPIVAKPFVSPIRSPGETSQSDFLTPKSARSPGAKTPPFVEPFRKKSLSPVSEVNTEEEQCFERKLSQDCRRLKPPKGLTQREKLEWIQKNRCVGVWVECCNEQCMKWRYLRDVLDPMAVPDKWYCSMNSDVRYNSCSKQMCPYYNGKELINVMYTAGSIVWAKLRGYPSWPAMVDDDPEFAHFYWLPMSKSKTPVQYHVVFFDTKEVTRAWLPMEYIQPFQFTSNHSKYPKNKFSAIYQRRLSVSILEANKALEMTLPERMSKYSFIARYKGPIYSFKDNIQDFVKKNKLPPYEDSSLSESEETDTVEDEKKPYGSNVEWLNLEEKERLIGQSELQSNKRKQYDNSQDLKETDNNLFIKSELELNMADGSTAIEYNSSSSLSPHPRNDSDNSRSLHEFLSPAYESNGSESSNGESLLSPQYSRENIVVKAEVHKQPRQLESQKNLKESILLTRNVPPKRTYERKKNPNKKDESSSFDSLMQSLESKKRSTSPSWDSQTTDEFQKEPKMLKSPKIGSRMLGPQGVKHTLLQNNQNIHSIFYSPPHHSLRSSQSKL